MKIALLQLKTMPNPEENLEKIKQMLVQAKQEGADLAVLPEMCCCPYENSAFVRYAMPENAPFLQGIAEMAGTLGLYVVAGSVPLAADGRIYNAAFVYDNRGSCIARHRKTICLISMWQAVSISWNPIPLPPAGMSPPSIPLGGN